MGGEGGRVCLRLGTATTVAEVGLPPAPAMRWSSYCITRPAPLPSTHVAVEQHV